MSAVGCRRLWTFLTIFAAAPLAAPSHVCAQIRLSWNAPYGMDGWSQSGQAACTLDETHRMYVTLTPAADVPLEGMRLRFAMRQGDPGFGCVPPPPPPPPLSPFWQFEEGGCNDQGLFVDLAPQPNGLPSPWGGFSVRQMLVTFAPDTPDPGFALLDVDIERTTATTLLAGTTYQLMTLLVRSCAAQACEGCSDEFVTGLQSIETPSMRFTDDGAGLTVVYWHEFSICGPTLPSVSARVGARPAGSAQGCDVPTPTRSRTWGALKVVYR